MGAALPGFAPRAEQLTMAREVEATIARRGVLLAEAGTGTGKTLAYLIPALLSGRTTVVSTATRTLQDQLFLKDLPLLRERVGLPFEAALLKGRQNYLCLLRLGQLELQDAAFSSTEEAATFRTLRDWAQQTGSGDRAELDLPESLPLWDRLSTGAEGCLGSSCPLWSSCFVQRARSRAADADLVVVNHHLYFADLALRSGEAPEGILPRHEVVIFDEAHALEDVAVMHFGSSVSTRQLERLARDASAADPSEHARKALMGGHATRLSDAAALLRQALGEGRTERERLDAVAVERLVPTLRTVSEALASLAAATEGDGSPELLTIGRRARTLEASLETLAEAGEGANVTWTQTRGQSVSLHTAPITVDEALRERLYTRQDTLLFTSATLSTDGGFAFFAQRMGLTDPSGERLDPAVATVRVDSPFDYRRQVCLYVPTHLPEPSAPGFIEEAAEELVALGRITGGRAFFLFTSLRNMDAAYWLCRERLGVQVLRQGEAPKAALLEAFRAEPSVLFASHSFWEGVDVPGDELSLVVMDRLPFASPGEPLVAARIEQLGPRAFGDYQLPQAALTLRQGFGRLIRAVDDRGIVAVLDRRLRERRYGQNLLRSLPLTARTGRLDEVEAWWDAGPQLPRAS